MWMLRSMIQVACVSEPVTGDQSSCRKNATRKHLIISLSLGMARVSADKSSAKDLSKFVVDTQLSMNRLLLECHMLVVAREVPSPDRQPGPREGGQLAIHVHRELQRNKIG